MVDGNGVRSFAESTGGLSNEGIGSDSTGRPEQTNRRDAHMAWDKRQQELSEY